MVKVKDSQCLQQELVRPIDALHLLCRPRPTALGVFVWVAFQGPLAELRTATLKPSPRRGPAMRPAHHRRAHHRRAHYHRVKTP